MRSTSAASYAGVDEEGFPAAPPFNPDVNGNTAATGDLSHRNRFAGSRPIFPCAEDEARYSGRTMTRHGLSGDQISVSSWTGRNLTAR